MDENTSIDIAALKPVKSGDIPDLNKYHNTQVKIDKIEVVQVKSDYTPMGPDGKHLKQWVLRVYGPIITSIGEGEKKFDIRPSELFNLSQDKDGKLLGFPTNKDSNLLKFMKDIGASHPNEFVGKTVTVKFYEKEFEGQTRGYLKFKY